jgi:hypothetical protein
MDNLEERVGPEGRRLFEQIPEEGEQAARAAGLTS